MFDLLKPLESKLQRNYILSAKRIGKKNEEADAENNGRNARPKLLLVTLKYEADASSFHNNGFGRKLTDTIWINPDLTRQERDVQYQQRVQRRNRRSDASSNEQVTTGAEGVSSKKD